MEPLEIQKRLNSLGYGPLAIDGIVGPKTLAALKKFLSDRGLSYPASPAVIQRAFDACTPGETIEYEPLPIKLSNTQYYEKGYPKKYIFLHHTSGRSVGDAISWWNSKPDHVSTAFIIGRDGKIFKCFDPKYWAYALGLKGGTAIEKASIQIELVAWGKVARKNEKFVSYVGTTIPNDEVVEFKDMFRESYHYHKYTDEQLEALRVLLPKLVNDFGIKVQPLTNFWHYDKNWLSNPKEGIWSHSTVRSDKSDIMPQKELITLLYSLFP